MAETHIRVAPVCVKREDDGTVAWVLVRVYTGAFEDVDGETVLKGERVVEHDEAREPEAEAAGTLLKIDTARYGIRTDDEVDGLMHKLEEQIGTRLALTPAKLEADTADRRWEGK